MRESAGEGGTATFMILGDTCTRACGFCAVTTGRPLKPDWLEPMRVARAVRKLALRHAVVTAVTRDDEPDGGASQFAATICWIRRLSPETTVEVLIPDFLGSRESLAVVMETSPEVLNHNIETVPRLYRRVRSRARYARSLELLRRAQEMAPGTIIKSGLMVGLGETKAELIQVMADLVDVRCGVLTIGQYLQPSHKHLPVDRYYRPEEFQELAETGQRLGLRHVEAGPLVRSSYRAERQIAGLRQAIVVG